ncbi:MAG TPA: DUF6152 family protein [Vicinamibacterales bacterium]|nr:DUF6152 family protein [Vicinamibacterales bacterium]
MLRCVRVAASILVVLAAAAPIAAHHSFGVAFDANQPITLVGKVTRIVWQNPHTNVYIDVTDRSGKTVNWRLEGYPPNVLERTGWKKDVTIKVGDTITVFGYRARDGSPFAHFREAVLKDGRKLFFGPPPGTGEGAAVAR